MEEAACLRAQDLFSGLLEQTLSAEQNSFVTRHLAECPACHARFQDFQVLLQALHKLPQVKTSPDFESRLKERLSEAIPTPWWRSTIFKVSSYAVAAGLAVAFLFTQWMVPVTDMGQNTIYNTPLQVKQALVRDSLSPYETDTLELITPKNITPQTPMKVVNQTP